MTNEHFLGFVAYLNWFAPKALIPTIGVLETVIEFELAVTLLIGVYPRVVAWASAALLTSFALTMSIRLGIKMTMGYGVYTAATAATLLGATAGSMGSFRANAGGEELRFKATETPST